jgi:hypothetical protein
MESEKRDTWLPLTLERSAFSVGLLRRWIGSVRHMAVGMSWPLPLFVLPFAVTYPNGGSVMGESPIQLQGI